jgi:hypothetical protein
MRGTMIGIAPPVLPAPAAAAPAAAPAKSPSQPPRHFAGTMIGMAPPTFPEPPPAPATPATAAPAAAPPPGQGQSAGRIASAQRTVLGVARPGIAPLNPGQVKEAAPPPAAPAPVPPAALPAAWQPVPQQSLAGNRPPEPEAPRQRRVSLTATLAIVTSAMLLVAAVVAFLMLRGHGSVTARAKLDSAGNEMLELSCSECPDGTKTWVDTSPVAFQAGKATLRLQSPLKVGENPIVLVLERPGRSREEIALSLPIEFRVRSSTEELAQEVPKVSVVASVLPGTQLQVGGKPVTPDPSGIVRFDYDVTQDVTGPEPSVKTLERVVPYKATAASGSVSEGQVEIRLGITPLLVDAPGASIIVASKEIVLAGRTAPGAELAIGAQRIALDAEGRFVSHQSLAPGENNFTVRATLKDHAPRLVHVAVRRTDNLEREAALAVSMAQASYAEALQGGDATVGRALSLQGQVFDLHRDGYSSVVLIDVKDGCKKHPCLAKVVYGSELTTSAGQPIKASGKLTRFVDGPRSGQRIPEIRADLVVTGAR